MNKHGTFAAALTCMDGRIVKIVRDTIIEQFKVDYVDFITEPGINKLLAKKELTDPLIKWIWHKINISVAEHGSNNIVVVGHADCAGNPTDNETHTAQVKKAVDKIRQHTFKKPVNVVGFFVDFKDGNWSVKSVI